MQSQPVTGDDTDGPAHDAPVPGGTTATLWANRARALLRDWWYLVVPGFFWLTQGVASLIVVAAVCFPLGYWQRVRRLPPEARERRAETHRRLRRALLRGLAVLSAATLRWAFDVDGSRRARQRAASAAFQRDAAARQQAKRDHEWDQLRKTWAAEADDRRAARRPRFFS